MKLDLFSYINKKSIQGQHPKKNKSYLAVINCNTTLKYSLDGSVVAAEIGLSTWTLRLVAKDPTLKIQRFVHNLKLHIQTVSRCRWIQTWQPLVSHGRLVPHQIRRVGACKYYITIHLAVVQHIQRNNLRTSTSRRQHTTKGWAGTVVSGGPWNVAWEGPRTSSTITPPSIPFGLKM